MRIGIAAVSLTHIDIPVEMPIIASVVEERGYPYASRDKPVEETDGDAGREPCGDAGGLPAARMVMAVTTEENPGQGADGEVNLTGG